MKLVVHSQDRAVDIFAAAVLTACLIFMVAVQTPERLILAKNVFLGLVIVAIALIVSIDPEWWERYY